MAGINEISAKRQEENKNNFSGNSLELYLADGDQAYVAIIPSGESEDNRLDHFWRHSIQTNDSDGSKRWENHLCGKTLDKYCEWCAKGDRPQLRFAFWTYTYYILHASKKNDDWEEISQKGISLYKQTINEFRMFGIPFGRSDFQWNQLVDIHTDCDGLHKQVVRIKRTGEQMQTTYALTATQNVVQLSTEKKEESKDLLSVIEFYKKQEENRNQQQEDTKPIKLNRDKVSESESFEDNSESNEIDQMFDENALF